MCDVRAAEDFAEPQEYLEQERRAEYKSEYLAGEIFATAGASRWHGLIVMNVAGHLWQQLKGRPCKVHSGDLRLLVTPASLYTYADVMVVCTDVHFADQKDTVLNPVVLIEGLLESTSDYDRGRKFEYYRT